MENKLQALMDNDVFLAKLNEVKTASELEELFGAYDIQLEEGVTMDEALEIIKKQRNDEIGEEDLEEVSGGILLSTAAAAVGAFVLGGSALAFLGGYAWGKLKQLKKKK